MSGLNYEFEELPLALGTECGLTGRASIAYADDGSWEAEQIALADKAWFRDPFSPGVIVTDMRLHGLIADALYIRHKDEIDQIVGEALREDGVRIAA